MDIGELIKQAKDGNTDAFGQVYDAYAQRLFRFVRLKVNDRAVAEDLLQEIFVKAWQGLPSFAVDGNFNAWIYRIATNHLNDHFRKVYRRPQTVEVDETFDVPSSHSVAEEAVLRSDAELVQRMMHKLPAQHRQVLELRFVQDMSIGDAAAALGKTQLAVRVLQHRALQKLKNLCKPYYDVEYSKI